MWYSGSKYQRIGALVKASRKQLKAVLVLGIKKLGPTLLAANSDQFPLFAGFLGLHNF